MSETLTKLARSAAALAVAGMALAVTPAQAQESGAATEAPADLAIGTPTEGGPGTTYIAETHGDWEVNCLRAPEGQADRCQLTQLLTDETGNPVAEVNIFDVPDNDPIVAGATIITPLDTLLTGGLRLSVDGAGERAYPFRFCQPIGCFVRIGLTEDDLQLMRGGNAGEIVIIPLQAPDQEVALTMSLSGFTAGFADVAERAAVAAEAAQGQ